MIENIKIGVLVGTNGLIGMISPWLMELVGFGVLVGQIAVAVVTVWYIVKKIQSMKGKNE